MPTHKYFNQVPSFPTDVSIPNIPIISYAKLQENDEKESDRLFQACTEHGFFFFSLEGSSDGEKLLEDAVKMFELAHATFDLGTDVLMKHVCNPPRDLAGYKQVGILKTGEGKMDAIENYTINQDDILGVCSTPHPNPEPIHLQQKHIESFLLHAHAAICEVFNHLDAHLALPPGTLSSLCPLSKPSKTALRLLQTRPQNLPDKKDIALGGHTDAGLITMLFIIIGGLQILPAGLENSFSNWQYVQPQPNCALINLADTVVERTGGVLRSALHRVVTPPGEQAELERTSLAYLVRCEDEGSMRRLESEIIPKPEGDGEMRSVEEWTEWRVRLIMDGVLKLQTTGGKLLLDKRVAGKAVAALGA